MRIIILCIAIWFNLGGFAHSQINGETGELQDTSPVYFLVDASGSMKGERKTEAEELLRILSLPQDQLVSVTFFGSEPSTPDTNLCFEELDVPRPATRGESFSPDFPTLGGNDDQTAITNAIDSVLREMVGTARLVVITDGGEECNRNFGDIRDRYPNAKVQIHQVGDRPNAELQRLEEIKPLSPATSRWAPTINFEFQQEDPEPVSNAWEEAEWYERRVWLIAALSLITSAWMWGSSFGRRANYYESETTLLERKRREIHEKGELSEEQLAKELPEILDPLIIKRIGKPDAWRSVFAFAIAAVLGLPLIFFDFNYSELATKTASAVSFLVLIGLLLIVTTKARGPTEEDKFKAPFNSIAAAPITFVLGLVGIGFVIWAFWIDLGETKEATWFVLSARFSATVAISASAPILFVGSRWWQYEMAKSSYEHSYTETVSESIREKRRSEKRIKDDWNTYRSQHWAWRPAIEFTLMGKLARFGDRQVNKAREGVLEELRSIAIVAGGESASPLGKQRLEQFLESHSVADRIRAFLDDDSTMDRMTPLDQWTNLAKALENRNNRQIAQSYIKLARALLQTNRNASELTQ